MGRRSRWPIWAGFLVFAVGIPLFLILRREQRTDELERWLDEAGYRKVSCPEDPFGRRDAAARCYAGKGDVTLILGERWQAETANVPKGSGLAQERYIGVAIPRVPSDAWLASWEKRLGYGGDDPIRVKRSGDGAIVVWRGLHRREEVEKRLAELERTLK